MNDYLLVVDWQMKHSTDYSMDGHKGILRVGLQPGLEPAAEAVDVVEPAVDPTKKGSVSSGRCFELLRSGRIGSEVLAEVGW